MKRFFDEWKQHTGIGGNFYEFYALPDAGAAVIIQRYIGR
jgi:hypothetical protein